MGNIEVNIALDPVNDGAVFRNDKVMRKETGGLVIATNGETRIIGEEEAVRIMDALAENSRGEYLGKTPYIAVFNERKIFRLDAREYLIGSVLVMKNTMDGLELLSGEEFEEAAKEFESRLVTLVGDGKEFSAYEFS